jgi:hypothetical protein
VAVDGCMTTLRAQTYIEAPADKVWAAYADMGAVHLWSPNISAAHMVSRAKQGVGCERHCYMVGGGFLRERVTLWEEGRRVVSDVYETDLPMKASFDVRIAPYADGTFFEFDMTYELLPAAAEMGMPAEAIQADMQQRLRNVVYGMRAFVLDGRKAPQVPLASA